MSYAKTNVKAVDEAQVHELVLDLTNPEKVSAHHLVLTGMHAQTALCARTCATRASLNVACARSLRPF